MPRIAIIGFLLVASFFQLQAQLSAQVIAVEQKIGSSIIYNEFVTSSYDSVTYNISKDSAEIANYLGQLKYEFSKYPIGYIHEAGAEQIVLCRNLNINGQARSAIPDPYTQTLFLDISRDLPFVYKVHVMHHELHHLTEFTLYEDMYYDWNKWNKKNKKNFEYGYGGIAAYDDVETDYSALIHPEPGFLNLYATTGAEEDRCEIVALIMTEIENTFLQSAISRDKRLRRKVKLISREMDKIIDADDYYWRKTMQF